MMLGAMNPVNASMATRPCWSSASRYHLMLSNGMYSGLFERPNGSNPTSPTRVPSRRVSVHGRASDFLVAGFSFIFYLF